MLKEVTTNKEHKHFTIMNKVTLHIVDPSFYQYIIN